MRILLIAALLASFTGAYAHALPAILVTPGAGHPGLGAAVEGFGFSPSERVVLFFDLAEIARAEVDASGKFGPRKIRIPAGALPGPHIMSALPAKPAMRRKSRSLSEQSGINAGSVMRRPD